MFTLSPSFAPAAIVAKPSARVARARATPARASAAASDQSSSQSRVTTTRRNHQSPSPHKSCVGDWCEESFTVGCVDDFCDESFVEDEGCVGDWCDEAYKESAIGVKMPVAPIPGKSPSVRTGKKSKSAAMHVWAAAKKSDDGCVGDWCDELDGNNDDGCVGDWCDEGCVGDWCDEEKNDDGCVGDWCDESWNGTLRSRRGALLSAVAVSSAIATFFSSPPDAYALGDVGSAAPKFTLPATGGGTVALEDVLKANKYTVLYFYNQDFSQGCSIEAERFNQALPDFAKKGAEVVGVSMDNMEKHEEFCTAKGLGFKLLSDGDGSVSASYGADLKIPILGKFSDRQTFLIDASGTIKGHWLERDGSMGNVKTPAHTQQILEAIDKL